MTTCSIDDCEKPVVNSRGWCGMHYARWLRHGVTDLLVKPPPELKPCKVDGCEKDSRSLGLCVMHYRRLRLYGTVGSAEPYSRPEPEMCKFDECDRQARSRGYCHKHYRRLWRNGTVDIPSVEERFWELVYQPTPTSCWMYLGETDEDGYGRFFVGNGNRTRVAAHRFSYQLVTGITLGDKVEIDHKCHKHWCVQPLHLREASRKQNAEHRKGANRNSTTGILGVTQRGNRFEGRFEHNGKYIYVGMYATAEAADEAVRLKRIELYTYNDYDRRTA